MSDGTGSGSGSGSTETAAQGATGTANAQTDKAGTAHGVDTANFVSKADFQALQTKLNEITADNAKYRAKLRSLVSDEEDGGKAGNSKADAAAEMLAELRTERATNALLTAAVAAGAKHPELVVRSIDIGSVADAKGNVKDAKTAIEDVKAKYPDLFRATVDGAADGGAGGNSARSNDGDMNSIIRDFRRGGHSARARS